MISFDEFAQLVAEALDTLPAEIAEKIENVVVTVEKEASAATLAELGIRDPTQLFGLYHGVPRPQRSFFAPLPAFPDKIEIYFRPMVKACRTPQAMKELVRQVVVHEVGHHFGISDKQLRALGY